MNTLFIGNSFTARNDLPAMVAAFAESTGRQFEHRLISAGGASLRRHWNAGEAAIAIRDDAYDFVVLQEQSTLPVKNASRMHENVRLFDDAIRSAGAKTVLYMTWARKNAPADQQLITDAYTCIADERSALLAPAGEAWKRFMKRHDNPILHDRDGSHPTVAGTFLAACCIFSALFGQRSSGLFISVDGLTGTDQECLQKVADDSATLMQRSRSKRT